MTPEQRALFAVWLETFGDAPAGSAVGAAKAALAHIDALEAERRTSGRLSADGWMRVAQDQQARRVEAEARIATLEAELANRRMCVTCGRYAPAGAGRTYEDPACTGPDGLNSCLFDMTPDEAWQHWRGLAHEAAVRIATLEAAIRAHWAAERAYWADLTAAEAIDAWEVLTRILMRVAAMTRRPASLLR